MNFGFRVCDGFIKSCFSDANNCNLSAYSQGSYFIQFGQEAANVDVYES